MIHYRCLFLAIACSIFLADSAQGSFHFMQIEQVIGGVNGDTSAQAIQLRMRSSGQHLVSGSSVRAVNATGGGQVLLDNLGTNVANGSAGSRVLLATPNFANYVADGFTPDFEMIPIPDSYLAAGQVRFASSNGNTIYWSLSWGGAGFTGSTTASTFDNDADRIFGPPVSFALPSTTLQALQFTGTASALSTNNAADYALTAGAATFVKNDGTSWLLMVEETIAGDHNGDGMVDAADYALGRDQIPDFYDDFYNNFGGSNGSGATASVPEPSGWVLLLVAAIVVAGASSHRELPRSPLLYGG